MWGDPTIWIWAKGDLGAGEAIGGWLKAGRKILTLGGRLDTVRRFREYPERAVLKRLGGFWPA
jgi:hypothetical protein